MNIIYDIKNFFKKEVKAKEMILNQEWIDSMVRYATEEYFKVPQEDRICVRVYFHGTNEEYMREALNKINKALNCYDNNFYKEDSNSFYICLVPNPCICLDRWI